MSEKKQDITQLRQRLAQSTIIVDATRRFTSTLDSDEIQLALFEAVFQIVGAQQIALHLINEQGLQSTICYPMEGLRVETAVLPPEATAFRICEEVEPVIWNRDDDQAAPPISVEAIAQFDSYLALPLKGADKIVGVIEAFNLLEPQNAAQQADLLAEIAGPAGLAIYNGTLYQEAQHEIAERKRIELEIRQKERELAKHAAQLETVSRVSTYTSTILEPDKLLQEVVNLTKKQFDLYHVHIYLVNEAGDTLDLVVGAGDVGQKMVAQGRSIPLQQKQSLVAQVARSGQGLIENDVLNNPTFLPHPLLPDTRAETAVPVILRGRVVGVLDVQSDRVDTFTEQDLQIQTMLAAHIAVALENARSHEQTRTTLAETEALLDITKETSNVLELTSITDNVLDKVLTATNFDAGLLTIVNPDTQKLEIKSHRLPNQFWNILQENGLDGTLCDLVYRRQESVVVVDMAADAPVDVTGLLSLGYKSYQGVPLESQGEVLGTLCLFSRQSLTSEIANSVFLQAAGRQVGTAIRNVALLEQAQMALSEAQQSRQLTQEYLDMQRVLHEINTELFHIDDLDELYRTAIELAHTRLGFERIGVYLLNESRDSLMGTYGIDAEGNICDEQGPEYVIDGRETIDTFVLNRTRLVVEEDIDLWFEKEVVGRGWHIGAAMWTEDSPIGVVFADNLLTGKPLKPYQSELLFAYAGIVSNLIQRNRFETIITKRVAEMQVVAEVGTAAATILDTDKLLQEVVDLTKNSFDLYHAHIYLLNKETQTLVLTSGAGTVGQQMVTEGRRIPLQQEQSLVARAARSRQGVLINDVQAEPGFLPHPLLPDTRAEMAVPLNTGQQVLGVLDVQSDRLNYFTQEDIRTFTTLAAQMAVALQNANLFTQSAERAKELALINQVVTQMTTIQDVNASMQFLVEELGTATGAGSAVVNFINADGTAQEVIAAYLQEGMPDPVGTVMPIEGDPMMVQLLETRQTLAVDDVASAPYPPEIRDLILQSGFRSLYIIPMFVGRDLIGSATIGVLQGGEPLTTEQIRLAETLVFQATSVVQNIRLYAQTEQRETLLHTIIDSTPDWIFVKDWDHRYQMVNKGYADAFQIPSQDFIGKNDLDIGFPEDIVKGNPEKGIRGFWADDLEIMESGQMKVIDIEPAVVGGEQRFLHTIKAPLKDADGQVTAVIGFVHDITGRIRIEETLRRNEADLSQALKIAKLAYWEFDVENDLFTFNDQFYALFHTTAEAHGGYQLPSAYYAEHFVYPDDLPMVGGEIERALNSTDRHYSRTLEHRILYADGGVGYMSVNINLDRDEHGKILHYYGANQDITERKQAEEALRQNEADLSQALKIAKLAYWEFDVEKDMFTFNDQFYALFHTTAEEHGGYQLSSTYYAEHFVHLDDLPMVGAEIERSLNSTDRHYRNSLEHRILYADGGVGYISVNINVDRDEHGKILRNYGANQDITERKQVEEVLRQNEADLSQALKVAKLAYWEYDVEKDLFTFNDQFFSLFHTTAEEHGGYQLPSAYYAEHFVYPDDLPLVGAEIERALNSTDQHYSQAVEHRILYADGGVGYITVSINIDRDEQGNILRYYGANQDITERKRIEDALQKEQEWVQTILESINVPFAITKMSDGKVIYCNEALGDLVGVPHEELIGQGMPDFYANPSDREAYITQLREQGFVDNFDLHMKRGDSDEQYWALLSGRVLEFQGEPAIMTFALDITERRNAQALVAQRATELQTVAELGNIAATILEPDKLLQQVVDLTKERFDFYHTQIYLLNAQQNALVLAFGAGDVGRELVAQKHQIGLNVPQSLVAQAARSGQAVVVNDVRENPNWLPNELLPETQAEMTVPMMIGDRVVGVLDVQSGSVNRFTDQDVQIQTTLASQVSITLENARSFEQAQTAVAEMNALTRRLTREGWQDYLDQAASEGLGYIFDSSGSDLQKPISEATGETILWMEGGNGSQPTKPLIQPIVIHGETIGRLAIMPEDDEDEVDSEVAEIVHSVIEQLGARIENLRLTEQAEGSLMLTASLYHANRRINAAGPDLQEAVAAIAEAIPIPEVNRLVLFLFEHDATGELEAIVSIANWYSGEGAAPPPLGLRYNKNALKALQILESKTVVTIADVSSDERLDPMAQRVLEQLSIPSVAILPLWRDIGQLGCVLVETKGPHQFSEQELEPYEALVGQLAVAVDRQNLLEQAQSRAQREQMLRQITQRIRSSADVETIMRTAVQEIGRTLGRKTYIYLGDDHEA